MWLLVRALGNLKYAKGLNLWKVHHKVHWPLNGTIMNFYEIFLKSVFLHMHSFDKMNKVKL